MSKHKTISPEALHQLYEHQVILKIFISCDMTGKVKEILCVIQIYGEDDMKTTFEISHRTFSFHQEISRNLSEPEGSLPHLQQPVTGPYPRADKFQISPHLNTQFVQHPITLSSTFRHLTIIICSSSYDIDHPRQLSLYYFTVCEYSTYYGFSTIVSMFLILGWRCHPIFADEFIHFMRWFLIIILLNLTLGYYLLNM